MSVFCVFLFSLSLDSFSMFSGLVCLWWNIFCSKFVLFGLVYLYFLVGMFVFSLLLFEVVLGLYFLHWSILCFLGCYSLCFLEGTQVSKTRVPSGFFLINLSYTPHRNRVFETQFATMNPSLKDFRC